LWGVDLDELKEPWTRVVHKVHRLTQLITRYVHYILSPFSIATEMYLVQHFSKKNSDLL